MRDKDDTIFSHKKQIFYTFAPKYFKDMQKNHYVIIMAGGIGSRFWPMSRSNFPKQFHDILGKGKTLIQETFDRVAAFVPEENIYVVTNSRYLSLVKEQLPTMTEDQILLEPIGKNTAPCIAYACYKIKTINPDAIFLVASSDHIIHDTAQFTKDVQLAFSACSQKDIIMTLGITPTYPNTGYGYIQYIEDNANKGYFKVKTFTEKPTLEVAKTFIASGDFVWNSGIFIFSAKTILTAFEKNLPDIADLFKEMEGSYYKAQERVEIVRVYNTCENISIDYGIMEKADNVYVIPTEFGWSDLGTWASVYENSEKDYYHNAVKGNVMIYHASGNVIQNNNPNKILVINDLDNYIVVDTEDALIISPKKDEQFIKQVVTDIRQNKGEKYV